MKFNVATVSNLIWRVSQIFFFSWLLEEDLPLLSLFYSLSLSDTHTHTHFQCYRFYGHNVSIFNNFCLKSSSLRHRWTSLFKDKQALAVNYKEFSLKDLAMKSMQSQITEIAKINCSILNTSLISNKSQGSGLTVR